MPEEEEDKEKETIYDEEGREELVEDGAITSEEAGFMEGYDKADESEENKEDKEESDDENEEDKEEKEE